MKTVADTAFSEQYELFFQYNSTPVMYQAHYYTLQRDNGVYKAEF